MADEDDIRELIGRLVAAQRQGFHVTPSHIRLLLAALRFYAAGWLWLTRHADPHDVAPRKPPEKYTGPRATLGDLHRQGLLAVSISCDGPNCWNDRRIMLDALALEDSTPVPDIPKRRGLRCRQCGSRRVRVTPDWTDHVAQGSGKTGDPRASCRA